MTDFTADKTEEMIDPVTGKILAQKELAERLVAETKGQGVSMIGPGSYRYAGRKHRNGIVKALRPVYTSPNEAAAKDRSALHLVS